MTDLLDAVASAARFAAGTWPAVRRQADLHACAEALKARGDEIVEVAMAETGLTEARLRGELDRTCLQLRQYGDHIAKPWQRVSAGAAANSADVVTVPVPIGPVAVFAASNFPLAFGVGGTDTASALAAGCPVVVKAHPAQPRTGALVGEILAATLPPGAFHVVHGGADVSLELVAAPQIRAVGFTGSLGGGRALMDAAAARPEPIPVYAEMGSVNPIVVTESALAERADAIADGLTASVANFGGQLCTKPGVVFVPYGEAGDAFADDVAKRLEATEPTVLLNERLRDALRDAVGRLEQRAERLAGAPEAGGPGFRHQPSAYEADAGDLGTTPELLEEHFGPVVLFVRYGSLDDLLAALDRVEGQLTGTLHAQPGEDVAAVVEALRARAGRVIFDGFPTGVAVTYGMHHGGPFPATTASAHTSVGMTAITRWLRPVAYQNAPEDLLPPELRADNPLGIWRRVDGELTREPLN
jgi:acyl-CoA reductase-like NAD-dependent aldehyde dehydrogenase